MSKLISTIATDGACIVNVNIPQDGEPFRLCFAGIINSGGGWYASVRVGRGEVVGKRFYRTPGEWIRDRVVYPLKRLKLMLNPFPVYAGWRNYWMVDHVESWGVKRFSCGLSYVRWADRERREADENLFSCWLEDRDAYEAHERAVQREKDTGYRQTSRDYGLEAFENGGW